MGTFLKGTNLQRVFPDNLEKNAIFIFQPLTPLTFFNFF